MATASAPLSPFDLKTATKFPYSGIRETIKRLCIEGYIQQLTSTEKSKRGGVRTIYTLTFKGVLKYLANFKFLPDNDSFKACGKFDFSPYSDSPITEKDYNEMVEKFDKEHKSGLLNLLERQGNIFEYAPFQECRWLSERIPELIIIFITKASYLLSIQSLDGNAILADTFAENIANSNYQPFGRCIEVRDVLYHRRHENSDLMNVFGSSALTTIVFRLKKEPGNENEKLRQFSESILDVNRIKIAWFEQAVTLFSKRNEKA